MNPNFVIVKDFDHMTDKEKFKALIETSKLEAEFHDYKLKLAKIRLYQGLVLGGLYTIICMIAKRSI